MLTALLSDIHGNLEALNACLAHAQDRGAERFAFLGDLVGYGADARAVVELVARYAAEGTTVIKGNHDKAIEGGGGYFNEAARAALRWARETLTREQKSCGRRRQCRQHAARSRPSESRRSHCAGRAGGVPAGACLVALRPVTPRGKGNKKPARAGFFPGQ